MERSVKSERTHRDDAHLEEELEGEKLRDDQNIADTTRIGLVLGKETRKSGDERSSDICLHRVAVPLRIASGSVHACRIDTTYLLAVCDGLAQ